ncbi:hypothetical protein FKN04_12950 [Bacillus glycinifermentans]|uniref:hypothetical protein n=1 Tax=Bacillus glycinifermentans TaxID=1664069 RepID=UPI0015834A6B|nr:hypothetical protein [Bacillus glycinifermentans]NUJ17484.1 hypothetical protein [Bacillus glycinifermentans]
MDKPKIKHVTFCRNEGKFNWLNPKEINAQYVFNFPHLTIEQIAEMDLKTSFLVDIEKDYGFSPESYSPLDVAYEIKEIYDSYWIHTGQKDIQKLVEYLESIDEEQEKLKHKYEIENAKYQVYFWENELKRLEAL